MERLSILLENRDLLVFAAVAVLLCALCVFGIFANQVRKLDKAISVLNVQGALLPRTLFSNSVLQRVWEFIRSQQLQLQQLRTKATSAPSLADFGAQIVRNTSDSSKISSSLVDLILEKSPTEIVSVAVILKNAKEVAEVVDCRGVPKERLNEALLFCSDYFFDDHSRFETKFFDASIDARFNFSLFGIGQSMFRPLIDNDQCHGLVWVGAKSGALSSSTFEMLKSVIEYASASFGSFKEIKERDKNKDSEKDFLLGLSHDLRSPGSRALFSIREMLYEGNLSSEQEESLKIAEDSIVEQLRMLGNVLDIAKHDSGLLDPVQRKISLKSFLENIISKFKYEYQHKGLSLELACDSELQLFVDHEHLSRIFNNLLSNALKFTSSGGVLVEASLEGKTALISFSDTGEGIDPAQREQIFKRFDQGGAGKKKGGVGLGLFLSRTLAERNGGHLYHVESPFGGSKFVLELPMLALGDVEINSSIASYDSILIVEDDPATARMFKRYVSSIFKEVFLAQNVEQAEDLVAKKTPSIVVSDFHLGATNAASFFTSLPQHIPLVVVSGGAVPIRLEREGQSIFLQKPVDKEDLLLAVKSFSVDSGVSKSIRRVNA